MKPVDELFIEQATKDPDRVALIFEGRELTYGELDVRSDALAAHLRGLGVGPEVLVAIHLERSFEMVIGMMAVLRGGGGYLPLDPGYPEKRLASILSDAQPLILITHRRLQKNIPANAAHVVIVDDGLPPATRLDKAPEPRESRDIHDLAYVIYTSGSTGQPKGVEIEHLALVNLLQSMQRRPGVSSDDTMLAITTVAFDIAGLELFLPLICGARVVIAPSATANDGAALSELLSSANISVMQATPSSLQMLLDVGWRGDRQLKILCGGEAWTSDLARALLARCGSLWNMYGPTEATVWCSVRRVKEDQAVTLGPPIPNARLYVLDKARQLVPAGVAGELYIGGDCLARGYYRRPELTQERFVPDRFAGAPGGRMYRTGDLVRRLPNGEIEFLGRLDHQVKIRGHRIELGEIEATLNRLPEVERSVVVVREDSPGERSLVAYVIPALDELFPVTELRRALGESLPSYMIPSSFIMMKAFPLTPNGKLDRKALPAPTPPEKTVGPHRALTPTEVALTEIWSEILGLRTLRTDENFFELGGHSLLATRVIGRVNKRFGIKLGVGAIFSTPTIESLAGAVERALRVETGGAQVVRLRDGRSGPSIYFIGAGPVEYRISETMVGDRPVFGVDVPIASREAITMERLGEAYANAIFQHGDGSPCVIVGYSFKGKLAFESARALLRTGRRVDSVLLIDAYAWRRVVRGVLSEGLAQIWKYRDGDRSARHISLIGSIKESGDLFWWLLGHLANKIPRIADRGENPWNPLGGMMNNDGTPIDRESGRALFYLLKRSFRPQPIDALGVLIRTDIPMQDRLPNLKLEYGWKKLFEGGLEIVEAGGTHESMVRDGDKRAKLTKQIDAILERHRASKGSPAKSNLHIQEARVMREEMLEDRL